MNDGFEPVLNCRVFAWLLILTLGHIHWTATVQRILCCVDY